MRTLMLTILVALTMDAALADSPLAKWEALSTVSSGESRAERSEHLRAYEMSDEAIDGFLKTKDETDRALAQMGTDWDAALCARQAYWESRDNETFAQEVERFIASYEARIAAAIEELPSKMPQEDALRLEHVLTTHVGQSHNAQDAPTRIRDGKVDLKRYVGMRCQPEQWKE